MSRPLKRCGSSQAETLSPAAAQTSPKVPKFRSIPYGGIGSFTRIEGSKLSDRDVERFLADIEIKSFKTRDEQEVAGYASIMEVGPTVRMTYAALFAFFAGSCGTVLSSSATDRSTCRNQRMAGSRS